MVIRATLPHPLSNQAGFSGSSSFFSFWIVNIPVLGSNMVWFAPLAKAIALKCPRSNSSTLLFIPTI